MLNHDEIVDCGLRIIEKINFEEIIAAFIGSLSTKNLPARSAFGSYVVLKHLKKHKFKESSQFAGGNCSYCGLRQAKEQPISKDAVDKYPFQVQHTNLRYAVYDLQTFKERDVDEPTNQDIDIFKSIIDSIRSLPENAQLSELNKALQGKLKSNKHQRTILLETFGYAGILSPAGQHNFKDEFLTYDFTNCQQPSEFFKREWAYPVRFWTGNDHINENNLHYYFGKYM